MDGGPDMSGPRAPPHQYSKPETGDLRREVPDVSLVFNPEERSLVLSARPAVGQPPPQDARRSHSLPRGGEPLPPRYRTPPAVTRPSPLTRPPTARLSDVSISYEDGQEVSRAAAGAVSPSPQSGAARQGRPRASDSSPGALSAGSGGSDASRPATVTPAGCCAAEMRTVLRIVADNGRQLAALRGQVKALLAREVRPAPPRTVLVREAETQTAPMVEPATASAGVNTSLLPTRRDVATDPPPWPRPGAASEQADSPRLVVPVVTRADAAEARGPRPARSHDQPAVCQHRRGAAEPAASGVPSPRPDGAADVTPPPPPPSCGRPSAATAGVRSGAAAGRDNTVQMQARRVQEWVNGAGWSADDGELTLRGVVLPPVTEQPPSPEASLHVDLQEYQHSPDGSTDGSAIEEQAEVERAKPDKTFFQNVMGQVNQILEGHPMLASDRDGDRSPPPPPTPPDGDEPDPVRRATLQQLKAAGVSFAAGVTNNDRSVFDYSCVARAVRPSAAIPCSSDLSLEMNTLAMKYVDTRQLMQRVGAVVGRPSAHPTEARLLGKENLAPAHGRPTDMTMYGISDTNMSFSTRKYMEKFNLQS